MHQQTLNEAALMATSFFLLLIGMLAAAGVGVWLLLWWLPEALF